MGSLTTIPALEQILVHPDFIEGRHSTRWIEEDLDLTSLASFEPGPAPEGDGAHEEMVLREVDAEVDGRRYRVKLWVPDTSRTGQSSPTGQEVDHFVRRRL